MSGMAVLAFSPGTQGADTWQVPGQPRLHSEILSQTQQRRREERTQQGCGCRRCLGKKTVTFGQKQ